MYHSFKYGASLILTVFFFSSYSQSFRPFHAFGFQLGANTSFYQYKGTQIFTGEPPRALLMEYVYGFEAIGHYEYGALKWLGINSGLGLSLRGGGRADILGNPSGRLQVLYLNVPLLAQLKTGKVFWWEIGGELKSALARFDSELNSEVYGDIEFNSVEFAAVSGFRFNLTRGLSLAAHIHWGLTRSASITEIDRFVNQPYEVDYFDRAISVSVRYMFY